MLGLYAPEYNPLPWTSVPCADVRQRPLVSVDPISGRRPVVVGRRLSFVTAPPPTDGAPVASCRQYSFSALLGQCHQLSPALCYTPNPSLGGRWSPKIPCMKPLELVVNRCCLAHLILLRLRLRQNIRLVMSILYHL